jgi:glycosyltransferase involved in cell wall biosynthesis
MRSTIAQLDATPITESAEAELLRSTRVSVVVGGSLDGTLRREVAEGKRPRIDVLEMESRFGAQVYDFRRLRREGETDRKTGLTLRLARKTRLWSPLLAYHALRSVKSDDVVYATGEDVGYPLAMLMRARRVDKPGLVVRLDQPMLGRTISRRLFSDLYVHHALKRIDKVGCHSNVQAQYLSSVAGVPSATLGLLPPKVDTRFFSPERTGPSPAPEFVPEEPYILSAGLEMRDYTTLIEAVRGLSVSLVIGASSPWSHFRFNYDRRLPPNVHVASFTPVQMRELYRSARFVVVPIKPTLRTCGITVVLESWAMEKGVIVSRTIGQLDYAEENETVLFAKPGDVEEMRTKIVYLLENPKEAERLGRNGRKRVEAELNLDHFMDVLEEMLTSAVRRA